MPSESVRKPRKYTITRGDARWVIDPEEIRLREGAFDADGTRRVPFTVDPSQPGETASTIARYRARGYEVEGNTPGAHTIYFVMPGDKYRAMEKAQHDAAIARSRPRQDATLTESGIDASLEQLGRMTPEEFNALE